MSTPQGRFQNKVALITGGSTGIGAAIGEQLASEGASIALCGRRPKVLASRIEHLTSKGYNVFAIQGDVSTDAAQIVQSTIAHFGRLDILVNNAAISAGMGIDEMRLQDWRHVVNINLDGAFVLVRHALPYLIASTGCILHISSISAVSGELDDVAYAASKAGLEGFSRKLALEVAPHRVRSNVIRPGLIRTEAFSEMPDGFFESQIPMIPLGQVGQPKDIANAAAFLCSDEARFITGSVLTVDGGESAK